MAYTILLEGQLAPSVKGLLVIVYGSKVSCSKSIPDLFQ